MFQGLAGDGKGGEAARSPVHPTLSSLSVFQGCRITVMHGFPITTGTNLLSCDAGVDLMAS